VLISSGLSSDQVWREKASRFLWILNLEKTGAAMIASSSGCFLAACLVSTFAFPFWQIDQWQSLNVPSYQKSYCLWGTAISVIREQSCQREESNKKVG
jgi:hypothetical protein